MQKVRKRDKEEGERRGLGLRPWEEGGKKWVWWDGPWVGGAKGRGLVDQGWEVGEIQADLAATTCHRWGEAGPQPAHVSSHQL